MPLRPSLLLLLAASILGLAACRPDYPKCKKDDHCADKGEVCVEGLCKECSTTEQCKQGFECRQNACVAKPECADDSGCKDGKRCRAGKCAPECTVDGECAGGEKCGPNNKCVKTGECTADGDCPLGQRCDESYKCAAPAKAAEPEPETPAKPPADDDEARRRAALDQCRLERVRFDFNEFALSEAARATLDKNAECLRHKKTSVIVGGHADERGTEEYNIVLAGKRANAAVRYLTGLGVPEAQLKSVSYGEEKPLEGGSDEASWTANRRVEFAPR